jgi:hypothetical protein
MCALARFERCRSGEHVRSGALPDARGRSDRSISATRFCSEAPLALANDHEEKGSSTAGLERRWCFRFPQRRRTFESFLVTDRVRDEPSRNGISIQMISCERTQSEPDVRFMAFPWVLCRGLGPASSSSSMRRHRAFLAVLGEMGHANDSSSSSSSSSSSYCCCFGTHGRCDGEEESLPERLCNEQRLKRRWLRSRMNAGEAAASVVPVAAFGLLFGDDIH